MRGIVPNRHGAHPVSEDLVLTAYFLPVGDAHDIVLAQKVALREVNAHAVVNATTRLSVPEILVVEHGVIAYGSIAPVPVAGPANGGGDHGAPAGTSSLLRHAPFGGLCVVMHPEGVVMGRLRGEAFAREPYAKAGVRLDGHEPDDSIVGARIVAAALLGAFASHVFERFGYSITGVERLWQALIADVSAEDVIVEAD